MITINAKRDGELFIVEMDGHAEFNPGNDIVCAAASTLIQTLHASIVNGVGGGELKSAEFDSGKAAVKFKGGKALYNMTVLGFMMLQRTYPDNVRIVEN